MRKGKDAYTNEKNHKIQINERKSENKKDKKCTGKIKYQFHDVTHTFSSSRGNSVNVDLAIHVDHQKKVN